MGDTAVVGPSTGAAPRAIGRRRALPSGRAVVGGFLIAASAFGVFLAWSLAAGGPSDRYVVARRDLPIGARIGPADLTLVAAELPLSLRERAVFSDPAQLVGATVVGPVRRGELVQVGTVVRRSGPAGQRELSFAIEPARAVAGSLRPGEHVDVLATFGSGGDSYTAAVVRQARVLRADSGGASLGDRRSLTLTLALATQGDALALVHALNAGEVFVVRSPAEPGGGGDAGEVYRAPEAGGETGR